MNHLKYLLKTKKYYLSCFILFLILFIITISFSRFWTRSFNTFITFNNFSTNFVAYDNYHEDKDSFINFNRNVNVTLTPQEGEGLNVFVFQFIEGITYTDKSIINNKNIKIGKFKTLSLNEVAIPISLSEEYGLEIGDYIYLNGISCKIIFLYEDIYQIHNVDYSTNQTVIFSGYNTIDENHVHNYCNFDPLETLHQKLFSIRSIRNNLMAELIIYSVGIFIITFAFSLFIPIFRCKDEIKTFRNYKIAGKKFLIINMFIVDLAYLLPSILLNVILCLVLAVNYKILMLVSLSAIIGWVIYYLYLIKKVMR